MPGRKFILLVPVIFASLLPFTLKGQGELNLQPRIQFRNEKTVGVFLNSNGFGGDFSYANRINARNHKLYQLEFFYLKHPKEVKITNSYYSNRSFVFGKINSFYELKGQWGRQSEIYRKNDANGVSVRYFYSVGPIIGFLKPIYYQIQVYTGDLSAIYTSIDKFDLSVHQSTIIGKASFFEGIDEISIIPGASAKFGFSFEYSKESKSLGAIEFGAGFDIFPRDIPLMANESNQFFFLNLYAGYRWGKVMDVSDVAKAQRKRDNKKEKKTNRLLIRQQKKASEEKDDI